MKSAGHRSSCLEALQTVLSSFPAFLAHDEAQYESEVVEMNTVFALLVV